MYEESYHSASHCKYLIQYHMIWCPKFRFSVLEGNVELALKQITSDIFALDGMIGCIYAKLLQLYMK